MMTEPLGDGGLVRESVVTRGMPLQRILGSKQVPFLTLRLSHQTPLPCCTVQSQVQSNRAKRPQAETFEIILGAKISLLSF